MATKDGWIVVDARRRGRAARAAWPRLGDFLLGRAEPLTVQAAVLGARLLGRPAARRGEVT